MPLLRDADGKPLKRNFVHVEDLVEAILAALDNPRPHRSSTTSAWTNPWITVPSPTTSSGPADLDSIEIPSQFHSNWMDNSKAKYELGWRPHFDLARLIDAAWTHARSPDDPRKVWYPG